MRAEGPAERWTGRLLATLIVAFAAWTAAYHVAVVADLGTGVATAGAVALLAVGGLVALALDRRAADDPERPALVPMGELPGRSRGGGAAQAAAVAVTVVAGAAGAALAAFTDVAWPVAWAPLLVAAGAAVALTVRAPAAVPEHGGETWLEVAVVLLGAAALAVLSLLFLNPSGDDAHYAHLAAWIAANGEFPVRDVMLSAEELPALYFPPVPSWEPLVGTFARGTGFEVGTVFYLLVPPAATVLAVLAGWRLLRRWGTPLAAVALLVAVLFLLWHGGERRHLGEYFVGRMWQGKVLLLCIGIPALWALLVDSVRRPARPATLLLLLCAGTAAVGLTTTAIFVVPVLALGALAPHALRAPKDAALLFAATVAYPIAAGLVTLRIGGRTPDEYGADDVRPRYLVELVLGDGVPAFLALFALVAAPVLVPRMRSAAMLACSALVVVLMLAPGVPALIFDLTGLGRVLWRLLWVVPLALALGALATSVAARWRPWPVRLVPAAAVAAAVVLGGSATWDATNVRVADHPVWKLDPVILDQARQVLAVLPEGDASVLGPPRFTQTMLAISGEVTAVNPRIFFIRPLYDDPRAHARARIFLLRLATGALPPTEDRARRAAYTTRALRRVGVDVACIPTRLTTARRLVEDAGYRPLVRTRRLTCSGA